MNRALEAYEFEKTQPKPKGLRKIAAEFAVSHSTLGRLANGKRSMSAFNQTKQKLSPAQEKVLVDCLIESAERGFPFTHRKIEEYADELIRQMQGPDAQGVGEQWVFRFLARHHDRLQMHWSKPLDTQRAKSLNPEAVKAWFDLVEETIVKEGIRPEDIYGMDESGFPPSNQGTQRVVGARGTKTQHKQGTANRENVTAVVTICADGSKDVEPMIIFKGQHFMAAWGENNVAGAQ